ncbi:MAG: MFS transporter [Methylothermaceae bacterium]|nr:MFS transporter [Methylothermaceae bacterium]
MAERSDLRLLPWRSRLQRLVNVEPVEIQALAWSFLYFFSLLCAYYILRPMRDEMGIAGGVENLQWLFTGTFAVMLAAVPLFGWLSARFPRRRFLPVVYYFFIVNLLAFFVLFRLDFTHAYLARAFFIWVSVFNVFVVSVFWSFMTDLFSDEQARRLFGFIAAGGTAGALTGPALTAGLAVPLGPANLLPISAAFLGLAVVAIHRLIAWHEGPSVAGIPAAHLQSTARQDPPLGGGIFAGIILVLRSPYLLGIGVLMLLFTTLSTFLYFQQAQIIRDSFSDSGVRTAVFAAIDGAVNALTLLTQTFLTARLVRWLGLAWTLVLIPLFLAAGFVALGMAPVLAVLVGVQVFRRAGNYAIMRPAREMLYVVLGREEKYKAKNFNDTVVYRGGDAVSAWFYAGLRDMGLGLSQIAWLVVPLALVWAGVSYVLGRRQTALAAEREKP